MTTRRALLGSLGGFCLAPGAVAQPASRSVRVAAIDWAAAESLLALGIEPVAVANTGLYRQWSTEPALPPTVADLGMPEEPNLERLLELRPDLILVSGWQVALRQTLARIAPVQIFSVFESNRTPLSNALAKMRALAREFGVEEVGAAFESRLEHGFEQSRKRLQATRRPAVLLAVLLTDGMRITIYGKGSLLGDVLDRLGLENAWTGAMPVFGRITIGIERLLELPDFWLLYMDQGHRTQVALQRLRANSIWRALPAVAAARVRPIAAVWPFAGAPTALRFAGIVTDRMSGGGAGHG
ncbi:ABC transporter substrate-binding protein [Bosea rubneri]|uniref:ABC transporter substrate-binding protein n=1 Tax=Bosea rubneri TaxID=3075434 RepID=A0ABU3S7Y5_9HYPH|nr:ABC transporter substrate-binding protein [Bosea sp. ZW T0_25]MDU0340482.1 ABC transporter substrate-binding protein [Bosea sp. ZW T0_25]